VVPIALPLEPMVFGPVVLSHMILGSHQFSFSNNHLNIGGEENELKAGNEVLVRRPLAPGLLNCDSMELTSFNLRISKAK
jgi:hypothetical protein